MKCLKQWQAPCLCQGLLVQARLAGCCTNHVQRTQLHLRSHGTWRATCELHCLHFTFCPGRKTKNKQSKKFYKVLHIKCLHPVPTPKHAGAQEHAAHIPAVLSGCDCYTAFCWQDPNSIPGNSLSTYITCCGTHLKILQPPRESPNTRSVSRLNLSISMHSTQYSLLLSCWVFSIYFKLNTSLTACQRNSLYGINPLEITFAFSSQQNLTGPADSAGICEPGILAQP